MFTLFSSSAVSGTYSPVSGASFTQVGPGLFQATVPASGQLQFYRVMRSGTSPLRITSLTVANGIATISFIGASSDSASAFTLLSSPTVGGSYSPAAGAVITGSGGSFQATVPANGQMQFYRVVRLGTSPFRITNLGVAGGVATISFVGASSDSASAFTLLSSPTTTGTYSAAPGASITQVGQVGSGQFQATAPTSGPIQFYRILK